VSTTHPVADTTRFSSSGNATGHRVQLDGLRGWAALCIMFLHAAQAADAIVGTWYGRILFAFRFAVPVFFSMSGFLLARPFYAARKQGRKPPSRGRFFKRRLARIFPGYWFALTAATIVFSIPGVFGSRAWMYYGLAQIYSQKTLGGGLPVAWTLCVEIGFCIALPLIAVAGDRLARRYRIEGFQLDVGLLCFLGALAIAFTYWGLHQNLLLTRSFFALFLWFIPGMLMAIATVAYADREVAQLPAPLRLIVRQPLWCWLAAAVVIAIDVVVQNGNTVFLHPSYVTAATAMSDYLMQGLIAALVLAPAAIPGNNAGISGVPGRLLKFPVLCWFGTISYGVYLWHLPIELQLVKDNIFSLPGSQTIDLFFAALIPTTLIAAASWYLLERPILRRVG
jgi:acetyltransferase